MVTEDPDISWRAQRTIPSHGVPGYPRLSMSDGPVGGADVIDQIFDVGLVISEFRRIAYQLLDPSANPDHLLVSPPLIMKLVVELMPIRS